MHVHIYMYIYVYILIFLFKYPCTLFSPWPLEINQSEHSLTFQTHRFKSWETNDMFKYMYIYTYLSVILTHPHVYKGIDKIVFVWLQMVDETIQTSVTISKKSSWIYIYTFTYSSLRVVDKSSQNDLDKKK